MAVLLIEPVTADSERRMPNRRRWLARPAATGGFTMLRCALSRDAMHCLALIDVRKG